MPTKQCFTPQEYLARERVALDKHEYYQGEIFAMSGASKEHVRITGNIYWRLAAQLDGKSCQPFNSDLRVKVSATGLYTYPDVSVACDPVFEDDHVDVLLNPKVIIEVLSPSTRRHDREWKFRHYQQSPRLRGSFSLRRMPPQSSTSFARKALSGCLTTPLAWKRPSPSIALAANSLLLRFTKGSSSRRHPVWKNFRKDSFRRPT